MTINTIVCFFVLVQAETTCEGPCKPKFPHAKTHTIFFDSVCKDLYSTQRTYHITIIIYLTPLNAGPEFRFGNFSLSQVFTLRKKLQCLQGYSPAVFELYRGLWGAHFFLFCEGILCACDWLTKIHKSYGGGGGGVQLYI